MSQRLHLIQSAVRQGKSGKIAYFKRLKMSLNINRLHVVLQAAMSGHYIKTTQNIINSQFPH